jgi:hypothetical protein
VDGAEKTARHILYEHHVEASCQFNVTIALPPLGSAFPASVGNLTSAAHPLTDILLTDTLLIYLLIYFYNNVYGKNIYTI